MTAPHPPYPGTVIEANFGTSRAQRLLVRMELLLLVGVLLLGLAMLALYGMRVQHQSVVNRLARETREMNERNATLQSEANRLRSFQTLSTDLAHVPYLAPAGEKVQVRLDPRQADPSGWRRRPPKHVEPVGDLYGY